MKIPAYILKKLKARCEYARKVNVLDVEIHEWLSKKGISINGDDVNESLLLINTIGLICEPTRLMVETIKYIESKGEDRKNDKNTLARNARRN